MKLALLKICGLGAVRPEIYRGVESNSCEYLIHYKKIDF